MLNCIFLFLLIFVPWESMHAASTRSRQKSPKINGSPKGHIYTEAKAAYFHPTDKDFRKVYSGGGIYGFEVTGQAWRNIYAWGSGDYFHKSGSSIGSGNSSKITFVPLGFGLKYLFPMRFVDIYAGAGMLTTYLHMKDDSPFVIHSVSKWGLGAVVKTGANFIIKKHFFIDLFTSYSFMKIGFHNTHHGKVIRHHADLSGWSIGGGVGYRFGK